MNLSYYKITSLLSTNHNKGKDFFFFNNKKVIMKYGALSPYLAENTDILVDNGQKVKRNDLPKWANYVFALIDHFLKIAEKSVTVVLLRSQGRSSGWSPVFSSSMVQTKSIDP